MKAALSCTTLAVLFLVPLAARADESPEMQLDFVRKLRAKGYHDLALQYLENLRKNPPPALAPLLPLEIARTRMSMARDAEPSKRLSVYEQARLDLEKTIQQNPTAPETAQLRLEVARIVSLQGEAWLTRAHQEADDKTSEKYARDAEAKFVKAGTELEAAVKGIEQILGTYSNPDKAQERFYKQQLTDDLMQAKFERAKSYIDQGRTYFGDNLEKADIRLKRGEIMEKAKTALETVAKDESSMATSFLAFAWLIKVAQETDEPLKAKNYYERVIVARDKDAAAAKRWAALFHIQWIMDRKNPDYQKYPPLLKVKLIQKESQQWLAAFASFKNAPEGQAVQFELAKAYLDEALSTVKDAKGKKDIKNKDAKKLTAQAQKIFKMLALSDGEFSEKARKLDLAIRFEQMGKDTPVNKLRDFSECELKARYEMERMQEVVKKINEKPAETATLEPERKKHLENVIEAFQRALQLADKKTKAEEVNEARYYLTYVQMMDGKLKEAAEEGEKLAKLKIPSKRSAIAAAYALDAYIRLVAKDSNEENKKKLKDMASYIIETKGKDWQNEPVMPRAQYELGNLAIREQDHARAVEIMEKLPTTFSGYTYAQCQAAFEAFNAADQAGKKEDGAKEKAFWQQRGLSILRKLPALPPKTDPATAAMYFSAQLKPAEVLFSEAYPFLTQNKFKEAIAKYGEMAQYVTGLEAQLKKSGDVLEKGPRATLERSVDQLKKYAILGQADTEYRMGNYDKVLSPELAGGAVARVQELGKSGGPIQIPDYEMTGKLMALALRAQVQKGNAKAGLETLALLKRLSGPAGGGDITDAGAVLRSVVTELQIQLKDLKIKGDMARLKQTVGTFSTILDTMLQGAGKRDLDWKELMFLANCYSTLDQHSKAAELYRLIPLPTIAPKEADFKTLKEYEKAKEDFEKQTQIYWLIQVNIAREMRKSGQLAEAKQLLERVMAEPKAPGKLLAEKEQIHLLEDKESWGTAITRWGKYKENPTIKAKKFTDNDIKKIFFDAYFHYAFCWYKYSQSPMNKGTPADKKKQLTRAADYILRLEYAQSKDGWEIIRPQVLELLRNEPVLNQEYETQKKAKAAGK